MTASKDPRAGDEGIDRPGRPRRTRFTRGPLRLELGQALQRKRLLRGLTQAELAEHADLSLKYLGEIERGEANTTLEVIETLANVVGWDPMEAFPSLDVREPLTEGVRRLVLAGVQQTVGRMTEMERWLLALDPTLDEAVRRTVMEKLEPPPPSRRRRGRQSRPRNE